MKLVTFLKDHLGHYAGGSAYFTEAQANQLIKNGIAKDAYAKTMTEKLTDVKEKIVDAAPKDKMVKAPKEKK